MAGAATRSRLKSRYEDEIRPALVQRFGYSTPMQAPAIEKITLNMGVGEAKQDSKMLEAATEQLATIAGQRPSVRRARKSIAAFKLREGMPVGVSVTLRGERGYEFLDRLMSIAIPRIRDFRGMNPRSFDGRGNYSMGVREQIIFPEIDYDAIDQTRGLNITITTSARTDAEAFALLEAFGFPFARPEGAEPARAVSAPAPVSDTVDGDDSVGEEAGAAVEAAGESNGGPVVREEPAAEAAAPVEGAEPAGAVSAPAPVSDTVDGDDSVDEDARVSVEAPEASDGGPVVREESAAEAEPEAAEEPAEEAEVAEAPEPGAESAEELSAEAAADVQSAEELAVEAEPAEEQAEAAADAAPAEEELSGEAAADVEPAEELAAEAEAADESGAESAATEPEAEEPAPEEAEAKPAEEPAAAAAPEPEAADEAAEDPAGSGAEPVADEAGSETEDGSAVATEPEAVEVGGGEPPAVVEDMPDPTEAEAPGAGAPSETDEDDQE